MLPASEPPVRSLRLLFIEDTEADFQLAVEALQRVIQPSECRRVDDAGAMRSALTEGSWDAVVSDWSLPKFNALAALAVLKEMKLDVPFIVLSRSISGEAAIDAMRAGAHDCVSKDNFVRLCSALERELRESKTRQARREVERALAERTTTLASTNVDLHSQDSLRQALQVRDEFLSVASHELKTPLTSLKLQVQSLMRHRKSTLSVSDQLKRIDRQADRLTDLVAQLLDVSRITGNRLRLEAEEMDLADLVREVASRFALDLKHCGSDLRVECSQPMRGLWDRERMDQVVTNLISNAIKFGTGKPIEVLLGPSDGGAWLSVRDQGVGIDPKNQARIFERFERAVSPRHFGGLGLGLWIVRQIVEASGGRLSVESEIGHGSTFRVELPWLAKALESTASVVTQPIILVVDDDADIRDSMTMVLEEEGYAVALCGGGDEAFEYLRSHAAPALILLDLMMPEMDGYEFRCRQLACPALSKIPVVMMTAAGNRNVRTSELRGAALLIKPLNIDELLATIEEHRARDASRPRGSGDATTAMAN